MAPTAQPAADRASISTRSRSAGRSVGSRRRVCSSVCCSGLRMIRSIRKCYTIDGYPLSPATGGAGAAIHEDASEDDRPVQLREVYEGEGPELELGVQSPMTLACVSEG